MFITRRIDIKENRSQNNQFLWKLELGKRRKNMYLDGVADEAKVNTMCWSWESEKTQMKRREVLLFEKLRMVLGFVTHRVSGSGRRLFNLWLGLFQGFQEDNMWTLFMWFKKKGFFEISIGRRWKGFLWIALCDLRGKRWWGISTRIRRWLVCAVWCESQQIVYI
jgi:hypothetical protein